MTKALIVGLGREGLALARYLGDRGDAVTVADGGDVARLGAAVEALGALGATLIAGNDHPDLAADFDIVYLNPAVPKDVPVVRDAQARGIPVSALTDLFFRNLPGLNHHKASREATAKPLPQPCWVKMLPRPAGLTTYVGGNIGRPLLNETEIMGPPDWVVLEMSSFQMEWLQASPRVAVVTNLTPNHLDRHHTMEEYAAAKLHIVQYQGGNDDCAVLHAEDPYAPRFAEAAWRALIEYTLAWFPRPRTARLWRGICR